MLEGKRFLPETGMPIWKIERIRMLLEDWLPGAVGRGDVDREVVDDGRPARRPPRAFLRGRRSTCVSFGGCATRGTGNDTKAMRLSAVIAQAPVESAAGRNPACARSPGGRLPRRARVSRPPLAAGRPTAAPFRGAREAPARRRLLRSPGRPAGRLRGVDARTSRPTRRARRSGSLPPPAARRSAHDLRREAGLRPGVLAGRPRLAFLSNREGWPRRSGSWTSRAATRSRRPSFPTEVNGFTLVARRRVVRLSPRTSSPTAPTRPASRRRSKARAASKVEGAGRRAAPLPPLGLLEGRDADAHLEDRPAAARRPGGRPDAGRSRRAALRGRRRRRTGTSRPTGAELVYASNPDKDEALSTNADLFLVSVRRRRARPKNADGGQPGLRRLAAVLARRQVDRVPRAEAAGLRGRPVPPDALRPRDRRGARPDRRPSTSGSRTSAGRRTRRSIVFARPGRAAARRSTASRSRAARRRRSGRAARSPASRSRASRVFFAHELADARRRSSGASGLDGKAPAAAHARQRRAASASSRSARCRSASRTPRTARSSRRGSSSRRASIRRRSTRRSSSSTAARRAPGSTAGRTAGTRRSGRPTATSSTRRTRAARPASARSSSTRSAATGAARSTTT